LRQDGGSQTARIARQEPTTPHQLDCDLELVFHRPRSGRAYADDMDHDFFVLGHGEVRRVFGFGEDAAWPQRF